MFHFLSPRVATGTCYVSFSVSTCSHRHMLCFIFCLHLQAHALFHLLSPLAATRTCFVSFAVSTCRHRHMLCFICCLHLQPQAHALFHLLSPLAATGTCYISFAVSTCSHRQNTAGFQASAGQWPSARAVVSTWDGELEAACYFCLTPSLSQPVKFLC